MAAHALRKILTRDFVLSGLALFTLGSVFHMLTPTLPIYLSFLKSTEIEIGLLIGVFGFSSLLARPLIGRVLLRTAEKRFMLAGSLLFLLTSGAYLVAMPFWPFLIVRVLQGIGFACFHTAVFTLIVNTSEVRYRGQSLSYFILSFNIASALAPSVGMFLINHFDFVVLFLVCSGCSVSSLVITLRVRDRQVVPEKDSPTEDGFLFSRKAIVPSVIGSLTLFIYGGIAAFFPLYAISHGVSNPGLFFTTVAAMLILGRALGGRILNFSQREKVILPCLFTYIVATLILAFSETLPMFILAAVIWGLGHAFLIPTLMVYALDEGASAGTAMGTFHGIADAGLCLGPVIMGVVLRFTSYPVMFLCLTLVAVLNIGYFFIFARRKQR